jgi:hypothetical protein
LAAGATADVPGIRAGTGAKTLLDVQDGIPRHQITISDFSEAEIDVVIDGRVEEAVWHDLDYFDNMRVAVPSTGLAGEYPTEFRMFATERGLYVGAIMYQPPETLVRRLSKRDESVDRDGFTFTIDVSGEALVGYWFSLSLGDGLMDGKVLPERNYQIDWDGPWIGKTHVRDDGWSGEMFLPWSMMNMPAVDGPRTIGFAASRTVSHAAERYQWPGYPYSSARFVSALNHMQVQGVQPRQQVAVIPFASLTADRANDENQSRVGVDFTWKPSPKFEIAGTVNPDFGAVEADDVVLNLTALETFFPEKRLFFLEGSEVFDVMPRSGSSNIIRITNNEDWSRASRRVYSSDFLPTPVSLINTRRIGGTANQVALEPGVSANRGQRDVPTDLLGAAKVTGRAGAVRYGVMSAFEDEVEWLGTDSLGQPVDITATGRDFAVTRFVYEDIGASRRSIGYLGTLVEGPLYDASMHSVDAHYTSASGRLIVDGQLISGERDDVAGQGALFDLMYSVDNNLRHKVELDYMDEDIDFNDLGFLRRNNYARARYVLMYNRQKLLPSVTNFRSTVVAEQQYNLEPGLLTDSGVYWRTSMVFPGRNTLRTGLGYMPERYEDLDSRGNGAYIVEDRLWAKALLATDAGKVFSYSFGVAGLQEHLGDWTVEGNFGVTLTPFDWLSAKLDLRYKRRRGWLVYQGGRNFGAYDGSEWAPQLDVNWFISPYHQIKLSLQWVGVRAREDGFYAVPIGDGDLVPAPRIRPDHDFTASLLTAQLRYRWEIAPLTDFFIVYNRGNSLPNQYDSSFDDLFSDAFEDPVIDSFVAKLRYRFSN